MLALTICCIAAFPLVACMHLKDECLIQETEPTDALSEDQVASYSDKGTTVKFDGYLKFEDSSDSNKLFLPLKVKSITSRSNRSFVINTDCAKITYSKVSVPSYPFAVEQFRITKVTFPRVTGLDYNECVVPSFPSQSQISAGQDTCLVYDSESNSQIASVTVMKNTFTYSF